MTIDIAPIEVEGLITISNDLGDILVENERNTIHSVNFARALARGLANEPNSFVRRIAFGNGGTQPDAGMNLIARKPNNGEGSDYSGFKSRLHNEIYSEFVDENNFDIGYGDGAVPSSDPASSINSIAGPGTVSVELSNNSQVIITCVLNKSEPTGQYINQMAGNTIETEATNSGFMFDEIGLFIGGTNHDMPTSGYQTVSFSTPNLYVSTKLQPNTSYDLQLEIDGVNYKYSIYTGDYLNIRFVDLVKMISDELKSDASVSMDNSYGYMTFKSSTVGKDSSIKVVDDTANEFWLFNNIPLLTSINSPIPGDISGVRNSPNDPGREYSRMITHKILKKPIHKTADRIFVIKYVLNITAKSV